MLKTDLHIHTGDDPVDYIPHSTLEAIDRACELGFQALAITLHDRQLRLTDYLRAYAHERGIVLIPGVERTLRGKHILLLNFPEGAASVQTLDEIRRLKRRTPQGIVIAPHPFYPAGNCLRGLMNRHADLFDAVELNHFYTRAIDFNRPAIRWAERHGRPMVGNGDVHRLSQLGKTYSLIDAEPSADAICDAVRAGRVEIRTRPLSTWEAARFFGKLLLKTPDAVPAGARTPVTPLSPAGQSL
jgi:predicted metal-dependent phosphoesterase TrpH